MWRDVRREIETRFAERSHPVSFLSAAPKRCYKPPFPVRVVGGTKEPVVRETAETRRFDQIDTADGHLSDALTADEFRHREEHARMRLDAVGQLNSNQ